MNLSDLKQKMNAGAIRGTWVELGSPELSSTSEMVKKQFGLIYPTISGIAEDFARLEVTLYKGDKEVGAESPAVYSLKNVADGWTWYDFLEGYATYMKLLGEVFIYVPEVRTGRDLLLLNTLAVKEKKFDAQGNLVSFKYRIADGKEIVYSGDEVLYAKSMNAYDLRNGYPAIANVITSTEASESAFDYNRKFFKNDATPSLLIKVKQKLSEKAKSAFKAGWLAQFRGKDKAHKFALADGDMEVEKLSMSNRDMEFKTLLQKADERVLANWRMNKVILGQTEGVNRATVEGAEYIFARRVIDPMYRKFTAFLNEAYLPLFYSKAEIYRQNIRFEYKSPVGKDVEVQARVASAGVAGRPYMTINEARQLVGLSLIDDDRYNEIEDPSMTFGELGQLQRRLRDVKAQNEELKEVIKHSEALKAQTKVLHREWWKEHIKRADRIEPIIAKDMKEYLRGFRERIDSTMKTAKRKKGVKYSVGIDSDKEIELIKLALKQGLSVGMTEAWASADSKISNVVTYAEAQQELEVFLSETINRDARQIFGTYQEEVNRLLEEAFVSGQNVDELTAKLDQLFGTFDSRTRAIARTELNRVVSGTSQLRYEKAQADGLIKGKGWLSELDDKTRPAHVEANGQTVGVHGHFEVGGERMRYPGDPDATPSNTVNCRCAVIPVL